MMMFTGHIDAGSEICPRVYAVISVVLFAFAWLMAG